MSKEMPVKVHRPPQSRSLAACVACLLVVGGLAVVEVGPAGALSPPAVGAPTLLPVLAGQASPLGDVTVTEATPGQLHLGDVFTFRFEDAGATATLHFSTGGTVSGTNGLDATVALASSNSVGPPLDDEMKVTITATSATSAFPGVLTLSGLSAAVDGGAAIGNDKVVVSDSVGTLPAPQTIADADVLSSGTLRAPYAPQASPTILPTANAQSVGSVAITEPVKSYFHAGDVVTFELRDANGSANTVGLGASPYAAGGSMTVQVTGVNGPSVQANDTGFAVVISAGDPSNGSTSTIAVTNLLVNTAKAPLGPVTLTASVTAGPDVGTGFIVPGRVTVANVGGTTTTTAVGAPAVARSTTDEPASDIRVAMTAGSVSHGDTISLQLQTAGVTFTASSPPIATVTSGSLVFANPLATLSNSDVTATWTVVTGAVAASTVEVGPIEVDLTSGPAAGVAVQVLVQGEQGSDFTSQVVTVATVASAPVPGSFATNSASIPSASSAPFDGAPVTYVETGAGATASGSRLVLLSPYATQISAYRSTFTTVPTAVATGGLTLGTATVNSSAVVVATAAGTITAPAQTAAIFPVTAPSASTSTVTFSNLSFGPGSLVPPGALLVTGVVEQSSSLTTALAGNQVVDEIDTLGLGTSAGTTPPHVTLTEQPPLVANVPSATFAFLSDEPNSTFACALDGVVVSLACPSPITLPSLTDGSHTFTVQAFNVGGYASTPLGYAWTVDTVAPTATVTLPVSLVGAVTAKFSEPVTSVLGATVVLATVPALGSPTAVPATVSCVTPLLVIQPCVASTAYSEVVVQPTSPLLPGQHFTLTLNPTGVSPAISDAAGNVLATTASSFRASLSQDQSSPAVVPTWRTVSSSSASGGSYVVADLAGSSASLTFSGTSVTWLTATGPTGGVASVYVDGTLRSTVNTYAASPHFRVARALHGLSAGSHVLKVVVRGIKGTSQATGTDVVVDGFAVGSTAIEQSSSSVAYTWGLVASKSASSGTYAVADLAGTRLSFTFRGTAVTWITVMGPAMGEATVLVDGAAKGTFDGYASRTTFGTSHTFTGLTDAVHTVTIVVIGRHSKASTGATVAVDGFVVS